MGLRCASCGYDNDPTRVYCHSCGGRLERGADAPPPPTGFMHPTDAAKVRKPARVPWVRYVVAAFRLAILAALSAAVLLAVLPPRDLPPPVAVDEELAERLSALVAASAMADSPRAFRVPAADIDRWLVSSIAPPTEAGRFGFRAARVYAVPGSGQIRVGIEMESPVGWPLYFEGIFAPAPVDGRQRLAAQRYAVGRLPLPVSAAPLLEARFAEVAAALEVPLAQLSRASHIGVTPETVTLRWSGPAR